MRYMVIANGAGEYDCDYNVLLVDAPTAKDAADWAAKEGYGSRSDGIIFVVHADIVETFSVNPTEVLVITPSHPERVLKIAPSDIATVLPALEA